MKITYSVLLYTVVAICSFTIGVLIMAILFNPVPRAAAIPTARPTPTPDAPCLLFDDGSSRKF